MSEKTETGEACDEEWKRAGDRSFSNRGCGFHRDSIEIDASIQKWISDTKTTLACKVCESEGCQN